MKRRRGSSGARGGSGAAVRAALLLGAAGLAAAPAGAEEERSAAATVGGEYFQLYCSSCHGVDGKGEGPVASYLNQEPADLTRIAARREGVFPEQELAQVIDGRKEVAGHGTREMPVWGRRLGEPLTGMPHKDVTLRGQVLLLVEYLRSIQEP